MREIVFRAKDLYFSYDGKKNALDGASLDLYAGERLAVLGANGAGKSTFFLCLNGVLTPDRGTMLLDGELIGKKERGRLCRRAGIVFQNADDQIIASTVAAEVSFGPMNLRLPEAAVACRVEHALDYMELQPFRARPPHELSGGEKKRVTIADILAMENDILLFDEPGASLDPAGEERLEAVLDRLHADGRTLVISTHDMDFAYRWADRIAVFCAGRVLAAGAPETVFRDTRLMARTHLRPPLLLDVFDRLAARGFVPAGAACPKTPDGLEALLGREK